MAQSYYAPDLRDVQRDLRKLGADVEEIKDIMAEIASEGAEVAAGFVPVDSGALRDTVRGNRAKARATVTIGRGKTNKYAGVVNYGWPERNIPAANFVEKTDLAFMETNRPLQIFDEGMDRLIAKYRLN